MLIVAIKTFQLETVANDVIFQVYNIRHGIVMYKLYWRFSKFVSNAVHVYSTLRRLVNDFRIFVKVPGLIFSFQPAWLMEVHQFLEHLY